MTLAVLIQLSSGCLGVIGSLFFAIGVIRQSVPAMADISGTYFDFNPHMIVGVAAQKADYIFGGGIMVLAFAAQVVSYLVPASTVVLTATGASLVPWLEVGVTVVAFIVLRFASKQVAHHYEEQLRAEIRRRTEERERSRRAQSEGRPGA